MNDIGLWTKGFAVVAVACIASRYATGRCTRWLRSSQCVDIPNSRSSHVRPTTRGGGVGILIGCTAGLFTCWLLQLPLPAPSVLFGTALIALIGFADDVKKCLPVLLRLGLQLTAAAVVVWNAGGLSHLPLPAPFGIPLGVLAIPAAIIWIVAVTNFFNFLDGIDGLAATQGLIFGVAIAFLGQLNSVALSGGLVVAGACLGFLPHNWRPAKVFMGDVGSSTLGFFSAAMPFHAATEVRGLAVFATAVCLWFFLADATFTLFQRLYRGQKVWEAHRSHLYQRLVVAGFRHDQVVLIFAMSAIPLAGAAIFSLHLNEAILQWFTLLIAVATFFIYVKLTSVVEAMLSNRQMIAPPIWHLPTEPIVKAYSNAVSELPGVQFVGGHLDGDQRYLMRLAVDNNQFGSQAFLQALYDRGITVAQVASDDRGELVDSAYGGVAVESQVILEIGLPTFEISQAEQLCLIESIQEGYREAYGAPMTRKPK